VLTMTDQDWFTQAASAAGLFRVALF